MILDFTPYLLDRHLAAEEAANDAADEAQEALHRTEQLIRSLLVRPGSNVYDLLCDAPAGNTWIDSIDALVRRAADPLPMTAEMAAAAWRDFETMVSVAIAEAAAERQRNGGAVAA